MSPSAYAYKMTLEIPVSNGHRITVLFDDSFPESTNMIPNVIEYNIGLLQRYIPQIAELFYMPDHDFEIIYYASESEGPHGGYRSFNIPQCRDIAGVKWNCYLDPILIHELTHVFQAEIPSFNSDEVSVEGTATALETILTGGGAINVIFDSVMVHENGAGRYGLNHNGDHYFPYMLCIGWLKLYAYRPTIFREYTSRAGSLGNEDVLQALLGEAVLDSRPLAKWAYDQGLARVGPTEKGLYVYRDMGPLGEKFGGADPRTLHQLSLMVWQWTDAAALAKEILPDKLTCRFYRLTGEFLAETTIPGGKYCDYTDYRHDDAIRVDVRIEVGSDVLEERYLSFKYVDHIDLNTRLYYNYLGLVDDEGLPLLVSGTATVNIRTSDGSTSIVQSPVVNGVVKFSANGTYGVADIDVNTPSVQYHCEKFPFNIGGTGVLANPFTPYLGLYAEKGYVSSSENAHLVFTSYPSVAGGSLTIEYKHQSEETWQTLVANVQPQNGRYELDWGPTGETDQMAYVFKAVWSDGTRTISSNPTRIVRAPTPICDYSLSAPWGMTTIPGGSASVMVTVSLNSASGSCGTVNLAVLDWGGATGLSALFDPPEGTLGFASTLTITASPTASTGTFTVTIQGTGPATMSTTLSVTVQSSTTSVMGEIHGKTLALDPFGNSIPLAGVLVEAKGHQTFTMTTGADGAFAMTLPAGDYIVTAYANGYAPQSASISIAEGFKTSVDYVLTPAATSTVTTTQTATTLSTTVSYATTATVPVENMVVQITSSSQVSSLIFDSTRNLLNFTVSGPSGTIGFFNATIAKSLLAGSPVLLMDGVEHSAIVTQDANFWYIYATYSHSVHQVTIGGSNVVPEFPSILLLAAVFVIAIAVIRPRRRLN